MSILSELYDETIPLTSRPIHKGSEYDKLFYVLSEKEDALFATLSPNEKELYEAIWDLEADRCCIARTEAFVSGFRLGAQIMMEVLSEPDHKLV